MHVSRRSNTNGAGQARAARLGEGAPAVAEASELLEALKEENAALQADSDALQADNEALVAYLDAADDGQGAAHAAALFPCRQLLVSHEMLWLSR